MEEFSGEMTNIHWATHSETLIYQLQTLLENEASHDVTIYAQDGSITAHRIVLMASSPRFKQILTNRLAENKDPLIVLADATLFQIQALVNFMYYGEITLPTTALDSFMRLANSLLIRGLVLPKQQPDTNQKRLMPGPKSSKLSSAYNSASNYPRSNSLDMKNSSSSSTTTTTTSSPATSSSTSGTSLPLKRPVGRPRSKSQDSKQTPFIEKHKMKIKQEHKAERLIPEKRGRGRPPKSISMRGRPPKIRERNDGVSSKSGYIFKRKIKSPLKNQPTKFSANSNTHFTRNNKFPRSRFGRPLKKTKNHHDLMAGKDGGKGSGISDAEGKKKDEAGKNIILSPAKKAENTLVIEPKKRTDDITVSPEPRTRRSLTPIINIKQEREPTPVPSIGVGRGASPGPSPPKIQALNAENVCQSASSSTSGGANPNPEEPLFDGTKYKSNDKDLLKKRSDLLAKLRRVGFAALDPSEQQQFQRKCNRCEKTFSSLGNVYSKHKKECQNLQFACSACSKIFLLVATKASHYPKCKWADFKESKLSMIPIGSVVEKSLNE